MEQRRRNLANCGLFSNRNSGKLEGCRSEGSDPSDNDLGLNRALALCGAPGAPCMMAASRIIQLCIRNLPQETPWIDWLCWAREYFEVPVRERAARLRVVREIVPGVLRWMFHGDRSDRTQ